MSKFTKEMIDEYADKLMIGLTKDENKMILDEFEDIEKSLDLINKVPNLDKVEPMTHCLEDFEYELREDIPDESVEIDKLLQNCDEYNDREISIPRVVG